ncbi:hypothetical protein OO015_04675 [Thermomicrobium sp. 4228-Ro]|uniref:hypothetical protein n=1 Tax=Thermomicrobium sp. 4228-Ro TaxID=2993937 RepID=UPI002248D704|nr:hypothetical protein [Thermomicrobium sp. 4228-Ro]MCX2726789.1 hypothetical protein [Thermomicrobium sp. 4228-Ro]
MRRMYFERWTQRLVSRRSSVQRRNSGRSCKRHQTSGTFSSVQQADDQTLGIILWESEEMAHAFMPVLDDWQMTLDSLGHRRIA